MLELIRFNDNRYGVRNKNKYYNFCSERFIYLSDVIPSYCKTSEEEASRFFDSQQYTIVGTK